ncbi:MAG: tRNA preQ1(34) S-adenosylmethionine ribosyltransferase-isomerase QueA [Bacillota bacterium]
MLTIDFDYFLPKELIAQEPLNVRDQSRLLVLNRQALSLEHQNFYSIGEYFNAGDVLVLNNTKVMPARLLGIKEDTGARVEVLLLRRLTMNYYEVLVKPGKKVKLGSKLIFGKGELTARVQDYTPYGGRVLELFYNGDLENLLESLGQVPLPPYIHKELQDRNRYQTVYNKHWGSAAAPTAGLHFTEKLIEQLKSKGVEVVELLLHVGLGTFRPVETDIVEEHRMHSEYYRLEQKEAEIINKVKEQKGRVIAVGTTTVRVLETIAGSGGQLEAAEGWSDIFIYPGYRFKLIDNLVTNFHLPKSTLLMLVSAFAGKEFIMEAYREAIKQRYRFFSFGDAMLIQ